MQTAPVLSVVIPCLNEDECLNSTTDTILAVLKKLSDENLISENSFILYVDDGSTDNTWNIIQSQNKEKFGKVKGLKFSRNYGNQKAILAGLTESVKNGADCVITIDADLQQDENKIKDFILKYLEGAQIVLGIRNDRKTDGFWKKLSALSFYKLMNLFGANLKVNHSDYRLVSKKVVNVLNNFRETNLFLRGMFNELGFKKDYVYFDVKQRKCGKSKYTPFALYSLAVSGITSFSLVPLRMVTFVGFFMSLVSFLIGLSALIDKLTNNNPVPGWATIVVTIGFISGIQILCLGIIAEYIGQLFQEVKARPRYIIESEII